MNGDNQFYYVRTDGHYTDTNGEIRGHTGRVIVYQSHDTSSKTKEITIAEELRVMIPRESVHDLPIPTKGTRKEIIDYANDLAAIHKTKEV